MKVFITVLILFIGAGNSFSQSITYKNVEPIFLSRCAPCHRPGDAAPFSLTGYDDIAKRINFIKKVITESYMPPWRADIHYRDFANNRSLTDKEKKLILQWIAEKAPRGTIDSTGKTKLAELSVTAYKRKPDATLKIDSAFMVKGDNSERFITFKIPYEFARTHNIEALEFYTNNKKIIHHANYGFYDIADTSLNITGGYPFVNMTDDDREKLESYNPLKKNIIYYTGWIPGTSAESYPKNVGWVLPKRGMILLTAHYSSSAVDEQSVVGVNVFFRKDSIIRPVRIINFGSAGVGEKDITPQLLIMPNRVSTFTLDVQTKDDQSVLYVWPHMHYIGKDFLAYAISPANDTIKLVHIPQWDFRWQELYKMKKMVKIPKGSVLHIECTYDNTSANPNNPNNPPKAVYSFGDMRSTDEMMTLLMIYLPYKKGDENISIE